MVSIPSTLTADTKLRTATVGAKTIHQNERKISMWIIAEDGFLSMVECRDDSNCLLVRARVKGDIEHYFPDATVIRTDDCDYLYRAIIRKADVADRFRDVIGAISY
jgi:hypothetical protein